MTADEMIERAARAGREACDACEVHDRGTKCDTCLIAARAALAAAMEGMPVVEIPEPMQHSGHCRPLCPLYWSGTCDFAVKVSAITGKKDELAPPRPGAKCPGTGTYTLLPW